MNSCLLLLTFSCFVASTHAVKCFVCTSLAVDRNANADYRATPAYNLKTCQKPSSNENCTGVDRSLTIEDYYKGPACGSTFDKSLNASNSKNIIECKIGCAKITSVVLDRGVDVTRTTRQCAFYDKEIIGKYLDTPGFKRTGAGSDKVANWFYYCSSDYCNAASGLSRTSAILIASFYGVLAFIYH